MGKLNKASFIAVLLTILTSPLWAPISTRLNIATQDGTVSNYPYQLRTTNGSLIDNGNGSMTLLTGGGGGGSSLPLPAGATNYAQINPTSMQTGGVSVSSATLPNLYGTQSCFNNAGGGVFNQNQSICLAIPGNSFQNPYIQVSSQGVGSSSFDLRDSNGTLFLETVANSDGTGNVFIPGTMSIYSTVLLSSMTANRFLKTNSSKQMVSYDIFGDSPTYTGAPIFKTIQVTSNTILSGTTFYQNGPAVVKTTDTIQTGSTPSGATDSGSSLTLGNTSTTGGAIGTVTFSPAAIQTTGTGAVLEVNLDDPFNTSAQGYTIGDVLTMADAGGGNATIVIDNVGIIGAYPNFVNGVPYSWHVSAGGSGYAYNDYSTPTGGTGTGASFFVKRISGTTTNSGTTSGYADYLGLHANNLYANSDLYVGFPAFKGGTFTDSTFRLNGVMTQSDYNGFGGFNSFRSRMIVNSDVDKYGTTYGSALTVFGGGSLGLQIDSGNDSYPSVFATNSETQASKFNLYRNGQMNVTGSLNSPFGGFGRIQNLLKSSESPGNANWVKLRITATDNAVVGPDGVTTNGASLVATATLNHTIKQTTAVLPAGTYTFSAWVKSNVLGNSLSVTYGSGGSGIAQFNNVGTDWSYYSYTYTTVGSGTQIVGFTLNSSDTYYVTGLSLVDSASSGAYYKTTASTQSVSASALYSNYNIVSQGKIGVGVGMSAPTSATQIVGADQFVLQVSTAITGPYSLSVSSTNHTEFGGVKPAVASGAGDCGTSPAIVGNDSNGRITVGTGANGGKCTITFSDPSWSNTPACFCNDETTGVLVRATGTSKTSVACTGVIVAGDSITYSCLGFR